MTGVHQSKEYIVRKGLIKLLEIKDSDIRISTLEQCKDAVDKGIHIGGAYSATIPLVTLFYSGVMVLDIEDPTRVGQDMFVLSKGHAVAPMASIFADLGYFDRSVLKNSRSQESILNGHPGPILPGVHISTGPLGQGMGVAQGFALVGKNSPSFDVFCVTGDGELQEGPIWEAAMYSSYKKLQNLCVLVDKNAGQLDDTKQLIFPLLELVNRFGSFGWRVFNVDGTDYGQVLDAVRTFKYGPRDGRATLIICRTRKGWGGFSSFMTGHKVTIPDELTAQEIAHQERRRANRVRDFLRFFNNLGEIALREQMTAMAEDMNLDITPKGRAASTVKPVVVGVQTKQVPPRDKKIAYDVRQLPTIDKSKEYAASAVISGAMKVFAQDPRVVSIDADLASTSGLEAGVAAADMGRAFNVGVAEANMMNIGEAFAATGHNTWVSTFCPFFDWKVLRRIAIGYQERLQAMEMRHGWLSEGHGLDLTFVATAPNFETKTNGATHMGNDDIQVFDGIAHLKIIDVSCPNQLLGIMKWIMEGNKGLVYMRIMRAPSGVIYDTDFQFNFGKGYIIKQSPEDKAVIISSGRGVHEALKAVAEIEEARVKIAVVDMPSVDEQLLLDLYDSEKPILIAEQNNGYLWSEYRKALFRQRQIIDTTRLLAVNTLDDNGRPRFIHSATYDQLLEQFGLTSGQLKQIITELVKRRFG
jgi:transketolase